MKGNYGTRACKKGRGTRTVHSLRGKSSGIMSGNYPWIIRGFTSEKYQLVYRHAEKLRFIGILAYLKTLSAALRHCVDCVKSVILFTLILVSLLSIPPRERGMEKKRKKENKTIVHYIKDLVLLMRSLILKI